MAPQALVDRAHERHPEVDESRVPFALDVPPFFQVERVLVGELSGGEGVLQDVMSEAAEAIVYS